MTLKFNWETEFKKIEIGEMLRDWEVRKIGIVAKINEEPMNKNYSYKKSLNIYLFQSLLHSNATPEINGTTMKIRNIRSPILRVAVEVFECLKKK